MLCRSLLSITARRGFSPSMGSRGAGRRLFASSFSSGARATTGQGFSSFKLRAIAAAGGFGAAALCGTSVFFSSGSSLTAAASSRPRAGQVMYEVNLEVDTDVAPAFKAWLKPHVAELLALPGFESAEMLEVEDPQTRTPSVIFVLGGPGAGKGTQCGNITANYEYEHISAGDCLRAERNNPNSEHGALINDYIKRGAIVPVEITIALLLKAMEQSDKNKFLIDGFPRNKNNLTGWMNVVGDKAKVEGVLFFDCSEEVMEKRLLKRGEDAGANRRKDDNAESIRKRFRTYQESTRPIIDTYDNMGKCMRVDANLGTPAEVFAVVKPLIEAVDAKLEKDTTKITMQYRLANRTKLQEYFDVHAARLRGDGLKRFGGKMTATRRILKSEQTF